MIEVYWDTSQPYPIIRLDSPKQLSSWDEYHAGIDRMYEMARQHQEVVYLIFKTDNTRMPPGNGFFHLREGFRKTPENVKIAFMITSNPLVKRTVEIVMRILASQKTIQRYQFVHSLEEAYRRIEIQEATYN